MFESACSPQQAETSIPLRDSEREYRRGQIFLNGLKSSPACMVSKNGGLAERVAPALSKIVYAFSTNANEKPSSFASAFDRGVRQVQFLPVELVELLRGRRTLLGHQRSAIHVAVASQRKPRAQVG